MRIGNEYNFASGLQQQYGNQGRNNTNFLESSKDSTLLNDNLRNIPDSQSLAEGFKSQSTFFSQRSNNHTPSNSNTQLEKLKKELEKVKKHNSLSRSKSRNGVNLGNNSIKQVSANLKSEIIQKYKVNPDALVTVEKNSNNQQRQSQTKEGQGYLEPQNKVLSRSSSTIILQQALQNNEKCINTKVFARFRPLNKIEVELTKNDLGIDCCLYPDEKTVVLMPESTVFTMDSVFDPNTNQSKIYELVGRETIADVMNGYNGTIFAYGQTGSGKTYSMFGDIYNRTLKGLIPRSIEHIFKTINSCDIDIEFILTCSMLEIYKENLHDLLCTQKCDLKIKESPTRGIYVEGLTQLCVGTENELLTMLELGEQARKVAATRINQYSSRSHTIFMLEIKQRYPNDTEKKGKLNLVDLAGSEKVGKTGAMGDILEEAKKINLSLSCLGNVIHSLTTNSDHIPYRDSKLTRILQESLGGNFKTSLLVTCSSHSSSLEETLSTLKFATRAKSIKNHFKMNIKNSPEALQRIIHQLKRDLMEAKQEIDRLKKFQEISIPSEDAIHNLPSHYDSSALMNMNKAIFKKTDNFQQELKQFEECNEEDESDIDSIQKDAILQERIEVQTTEIIEYKQALKEQEIIIKRQDIQIEMLNRQNLKLQEKLSLALQDKEGLNLRIQNSNSSSEQEISLRERQMASLQDRLKKYESYARDLIKEKAQTIDQGFMSILQQAKQMPAKYENGNEYLSSEPLALKSNINIILKDMKACISNQKISKCRLQELANKIETQIHTDQENSKESSNLYLLFYETLRLETLHSSLECSIQSLEIQESLNYQKHKILKNKCNHQRDTSANLQEILENAKRTHEILRQRIDNLEEESAQYQERLDSQFSCEKPKGKIISIVSNNHGGLQRSSISSTQNAAKMGRSEVFEVLQECIIDELTSWKQEGISNLDNICQSISIKGLKSHKNGVERLNKILSQEGYSEGHSTITQNILTDENSRLREKVLVLTTEMSLATKKAEILEMELMKRGAEVQKINQLLKCTRQQSESLQKEEFSKLRKQIEESHKPIYSEILAFFKRQNAQAENSDQKGQGYYQELSTSLQQVVSQPPSSQNSFNGQLQKQKSIPSQQSSFTSVSSNYGNQNQKSVPIIPSANVVCSTNISSNPSTNKSNLNNYNFPVNYTNSNTSVQPPHLSNSSSKNPALSLGFRYDYSFLQDTTTQQQNKSGNPAQQYQQQQYQQQQQHQQQQQQQQQQQYATKY